KMQPASLGQDGYLSASDYKTFSGYAMKLDSVVAGAGINVDGAMTMPRVNASFGSMKGTVTEGNDPRLADARAPTPNSPDYIQNSMAPQNASFNVTGAGTVGGDVLVGGRLGIGAMSAGPNLYVSSGATEATIHLNAATANGVPVIRLLQQGMNKWG